MSNRSPDFHDRRSFTRYTTRDCSAVMLEPCNIVSYCILDVSRSGMAFCYNGTSDECKLINNASVTLFGENIGASDISVRIISDTELNEEDLAWHPLWEDKSETPCLRRCGVKFESLSQAQEDSIDLYIQGLEIGMRHHSLQASSLPEFI
jgi:hypothetical protein